MGTPAAKAEPTKKAEAGKKGRGKGVSEVVKKKAAIEEPLEVLAPRKGKGTKAAAIIAAITEASDHETEPEPEVKKGGKGKKKTEMEKKAPPAPAKKPVKKPPPPPQPQRKTKKR